MEPLRIFLVYLAAFWLFRGYAYGGDAEIYALHEVRLDVADGSLDGTVDILRIHKKIANAPAKPTQRELDGALRKARDKFNVQPGYGGFMKYLMQWDLLALLSVLGVTLNSIISHGFGVGECRRLAAHCAVAMLDCDALPATRTLLSRLIFTPYETL